MSYSSDLIDAYCCERVIAHLVLQSLLVLSIVIIPNVQPAVVSDKEENARSGWGPAAIYQKVLVVFGAHDGGFELVFPNLII